MNRLVTSAVFVPLLLQVLAAPCMASCEATLTARSRYLTFETYQLYPILVTDDSLGRRELEAGVAAMWDQFSRGLASAVRCHARIEGDRALASRLKGSPCTLRLEATKANQPELTSFGSLPDSLLQVFRGPEGDSVANLYSVLLGSYVKGSAAESLVASVSIPEEEDSESGWDSTVVMDIRYSDCFASFHRTAFVLPPKLTANRELRLRAARIGRLDSAGGALRSPRLLARHLRSHAPRGRGHRPRRLNPGAHIRAA